MARGYTLIARNLRTRTGEIDLLARRGRLLLAVEVKTRRHHAAPELTLQPRQLARLEASLLRLAAVQRPRPRLLRVDVCAVRVLAADTMEVLHLEGTEFLPHPDSAA